MQNKRCIALRRKSKQELRSNLGIWQILRWKIGAGIEIEHLVFQLVAQQLVIKVELGGDHLVN